MSDNFFPRSEFKVPMPDVKPPKPDLNLVAARWKKARRAVHEASVFDKTYRDKLNELSEAEDALSRAIPDV